MIGNGAIPSFFAVSDDNYILTDKIYCVFNY